MAATTRAFKDVEAPEPAEIGRAAEQIEIARQALRKAGHHLDASSTRHLHIGTLDLKDGADKLSVKLTEFAGD